MPQAIARRNLNRAIRKRLKVKHGKTLAMLHGMRRVINEKADVAARVAAAHIAAGDAPRGVDEVAILATGLLAYLIDSFRRLARWSWGETVTILAREIPREPLAQLAQERESEPDQPEPPPADDDKPILDVTTLNLAAWTAYLASTLFQSPRPHEVTRIINQPLDGVAWPARLTLWARRAEFRIRQTAFQRALAARGGVFTPVELERLIRADLQEMATAVQRIAENEGFRIAQAIQTLGYGRLGSLLAGVMILNPLDERTRPTHRERAGTIYWTQPGRQPNIVDAPNPPDAPNCRCHLVPILATELA